MDIWRLEPLRKAWHIALGVGSGGMMKIEMVSLRHTG
jgi:hypothetical protein